MLRGLLSPKRVVALVVALAVIAGLVVSSIWLDKRADGRRPMYRALLQMEGLQWDLLTEGKPGRAMVLKHGGPPRRINGHVVEVPPGVTIRVENRDGSTCVAAEDRHGDRTAWQCVDIHATRPSLGGLQ
ncbi:MAG TPA: hypothetical protein VN088_15585 [Nocardioides sp.]|nr:hypothetical protein [Nocardioides sp.]